MDLQGHQRLARYLFWFAQVVGVATVVLLILFVGGNLLSELIAKEINMKEDYSPFILLAFEICIVVSFTISWKRKRLGPILILLFTILICALWGWEDMNIIWMHLPLLFSGLLLLFYSYYKEWILKRKP